MSDDAVVFEILWIENADVVGTYPDIEAAKATLTAWVAEHPHIREEVAVVGLDADGIAVYSWQVPGA